MFTNQISELKKMSEGLCDEIAKLEDEAKNKRTQLRDVNQALASLERVQSKYDTTTQDELVEVEESCDN